MNFLDVNRKREINFLDAVMLIIDTMIKFDNHLIFQFHKLIGLLKNDYENSNVKSFFKNINKYGVVTTCIYSTYNSDCKKFQCKLNELDFKISKIFVLKRKNYEIIIAENAVTKNSHISVVGGGGLMKMDNVMLEAKKTLEILNSLKKRLSADLGDDRIIIRYKCISDNKYSVDHISEDEYKKLFEKHELVLMSTPEKLQSYIKSTIWVED